MATAKFQFRVVYFRPSGKMYASASFPLEVTDVTPAGSGRPPSPYMADVVEWLSLHRRGEFGFSLPGLSGGWLGHILVEPEGEEGFPVLIPALLEAGD